MIIPMIVLLALFLLPVVGSTSVLGSSQGCLSDDPSRCNGMWWGQYLGELKQMRFVGSDPTNIGELFYVSQGDVLELGDAKLDYVQYGFWREIYSSILFGTKGVSNWEALRSICFANLEGWHKPYRYIEKYYWVGKHTAMTLEYNETQSDGRLLVYSKTIHERRLASEGKGSQSRSSGRFWR